MRNMQRQMRSLALASLVLAACGDDVGSSAEGAFGYGDNVPNSYNGEPSPTSGDGREGGAQEPDDVFIPEVEDDYRLQPPAVSANYVYVANTDLNSVARIDSVTLAIDTFEVGLEPITVQARRDSDMAVVLNRGSDDVTVIQGPNVSHIDVQRGANRLVLTPTGEFVIAYYDDGFAESDDTPGSLSDATLIDLRPEIPTAANLVVGLHIREIEFDDEGGSAYFVTDDGVAVVEMANVDGDQFIPPVRLSVDVISDQEAIDREVEVTGDGAFALVRSSDATSLRLVNLSDGSIDELELGAIPTDVDLHPKDGRVIVVLRSLSQVVVIPIPGGFDDPDRVQAFDLGDEVVGLATHIPSTDVFALFSTLDQNDHLVLLDVETGVRQVLALRKGIASVHPSTDGGRALIFHTKVPGTPIPNTPEFLERSYGYTVLDLTTDAFRLVLTETDPGPFTFTEDGNMAFILLADEDLGIRSVDWANLVTGRDQTIDFRRLPQGVGVIPATGRVFVSQEHAVGRMAFIDINTGEVREVTGFHLNSRTE